MAQDFSKGKIYKITNDYNDDIYVGSTCNTLVKRFIKHKEDHKREKNKNIPLYKLMSEIGFDRFRIHLVEDFPSDDKYHLRQREGYWIRQISTLNIRIEDRTKAEYNKQYKEENIDKLNEYHKNYWKNYFEENKDEYNENRKKDYHNRKDEIRVRMICECGTEVCKRDLPKHLKTQKHIKLMEHK